MTGLLATIAVPAVFAALAYRLGMVSRGGALGGFVVAALIYTGLGWQGFVVLALFVVGSSVLTRIGYRRKERTGTAESGGGRRGAEKRPGERRGRRRVRRALRTHAISGGIRGGVRGLFGSGLRRHRRVPRSDNCSAGRVS